MEWMTLPARVLLSAIFGVAGFTKLTDLERWRQAIAEFGVPASVSGPIALTLPIIELAIAALFWSAGTARWAAWAALALLCVFTLAIWISLVRGRRPNCHCFGQLHSSPIGWRTVVRNGCLAILAALVLWRGEANPGVLRTGVAAGLSPGNWTALTVAAVALALAIMEGWLIVNLLSQQGRFLVRLESVERTTGTGPGTGLPVGQPAPEFAIRNLDGGRTSLAALRSSGRAILLLFTNPDCVPCDALMHDVGRWQREYLDDLTLALISRGSLEANRRKAHEYGLEQLLLQNRREVAQAYHVESTPAAVLIDADGRIASRIAYGAERIEELLRHAVASAALATGPTRDETAGRVLPVGAPAPALVLVDLDGDSIDLSGLRGHATVVLFWSPDCAFCQAMLPALSRLEKNRSAQSADLLIISTGTVEANRAMSLTSPIVLDSDGSAMRAFGASGTPMAVLVDGSGRIGSPLVAGEKEVMALARAPQELVGM